jgi:transcriptional regulator with XRE-family HTH domain
MDYAELGRRIRQAREEAALSQEAVARHLGLSRSAVSLIEGGKRKIDSLELREFAQLVGRSILFFLDGESAAGKPSNQVESGAASVLFSANQVPDLSQDREQIERLQQFYQDFQRLARMLHRIPNPYSTEPVHRIFKLTPAAAKWMARKERARLGLIFSTPIRNMWELLESQGIRVMAWDLKTPKFGGCFLFTLTLGSFILVKRNLGSFSANQINYVLAHEYCHYLIDRQPENSGTGTEGNYHRVGDYFAQWFAANFLMPEEALFPQLEAYVEKSNGIVTAEIVMHLALDFGVTYTAMLNRLVAKGVELIDKGTRKELAKHKPSELMARIGRVPPYFELRRFPREYEDMAFEACQLGYIDSYEVARLLEIDVKAAEAQLNDRKALVGLGVDSELELQVDIENA